VVDAGTSNWYVVPESKKVVSSRIWCKSTKLLDAEQLKSALEAGVAIDKIVAGAFKLAATACADKKPITEYDIKSGYSGNLKERELPAIRAGYRGERGMPAIHTMAHAGIRMAYSRR